MILFHELMSWLFNGNGAELSFMFVPCLVVLNNNNGETNGNGGESDAKGGTGSSATKPEYYPIKPIIIVVNNQQTRTLVGIYPSQSTFQADTQKLFGFSQSPKSFNTVLLNDGGMVHCNLGSFIISYIDRNELLLAATTTRKDA